MDRLNHADNILMNRRDLFSILQDMIYSNISKVVWSIYKYSPLKIICGESEVGMLSETDFQVTRTGIGTIGVSPGIAVEDQLSFITLASGASVSLSGFQLDDGVNYVHIGYRQDKSFTGKELPVPVKGKISGDTMYTVIEDSAEISIDADAVSGKIPLAMVACVSGDVMENCKICTLTSDIYSGENNLAIPAVGGYFLDEWVRTIYKGQGNTYTIPLVLSGTEYVDCEIVEGQSSIESATITSRGKYGTVPRHHYSGEFVYVPAIIDLRQQNILQHKGADREKTLLGNGMLNVGGATKRIKTMTVPRMTVAPIISIGPNPLTWTNRSRSMGMVTDRIKNAYYGIQSSNTNMDNYKAAIVDLRHRMLGADETERASLAAEMRLAQQGLVTAGVIQQESLAVISNDEVSAFMRAVPNIFGLTITINHAGMEAESIVQYEAEVIRTLSSSLADSYAQANPERHMSALRRPIGYDDTGAPIYPSRAEYNIMQITIPINIGERVNIRVRAISDNGMAGAYSNSVSYEFSNFNDTEYITYQGIYNVIIPDVFKGMATLNEYVNYIKDMWEQMSSMSDTIRAYQSRLSSLEGMMSDANRKLNEIAPIIPVVPRLKEIAQATSSGNVS